MADLLPRTVKERPIARVEAVEYFPLKKLDWYSHGTRINWLAHDLRIYRQRLVAITGDSTDELIATIEPVLTPKQIHDCKVPRLGFFAKHAGRALYEEFPEGLHRIDYRIASEVPGIGRVAARHLAQRDPDHPLGSWERLPTSYYSMSARRSIPKGSLPLYELVPALLAASVPSSFPLQNVLITYAR